MRSRSKPSRRLPLFAHAVFLSLALVACGGGGGGGGSGESFPPDEALEARKLEYLQFCAEEPVGSTFTQIARLALGYGPIAAQPVEKDVEFVNGRYDTSDFRMAGLLRLLYLFGDDPAVPPDLAAKVKRAVLDFKYWIDEPGTDEMVFWSENHQILFHSAEFLAGQLYPDEVFTNTGMTGREHREKARPLILEWIGWRGRLGFSEWLSNVYYDEDGAPLLNLVQFAEDEEIRTRAAMTLDLLFLDLGLNSHHGVFGSTHGRSYAPHKKGGRRDSTASTGRILWGEGIFNSKSSMTAVSLATSPRLRVPGVVKTIGMDDPERLVNRQRAGIKVAEGPAYGFTYEDFHSGMFWWGMGAYPAWQVVNLTMAMAEAYNLWENPFFTLAKLGLPLRDLGILAPLSRALYPLSEGSVLGGVNIYTYRTPDTMVSNAQDYQPGYVAFQQHAWEAVLDIDAVVFTTHPGSHAPEESLSYWTGGASFPRSAAVENVLVAIYSPILKGLFLPFTHAYFPVAAFDEVVERDGWVMGRKGNGYVALYSALPTRWATEGEDVGSDLIADGEQNVWICEVGRQATDGSFASFADRIAAARVEVNGLDVVYDSPSQGEIRFGWTSALRVKGREVDLAGYPRFDNPYSVAPWDETPIRLSVGGQTLTLDFPAGKRIIED